MGFTFNFPNFSIGTDAYYKIDDVCLLYGNS